MESRCVAAEWIRRSEREAKIDCHQLATRPSRESAGDNGTIRAKRFVSPASAPPLNPAPIDRFAAIGIRQRGGRCQAERPSAGAEHSNRHGRRKLLLFLRDCRPERHSRAFQLDSSAIGSPCDDGVRRRRIGVQRATVFRCRSRGRHCLRLIAHGIFRAVLRRLRRDRGCHHETQHSHPNLH